VIIFNSCVKEDLENQKIDESQIDVVVEEAIQAVIIDDILKSVDTYSGFGEDMLKSAELMEEDCLTITVEKINEGQAWPRKITLDFGEGCTHNEKIKSGKIIIVKTDRWKNPGSVREVAFEGYVVEGVAIEGFKRIENITKEREKQTFKIEVNLELTSTTKNDIVKVVKRKAEKIQVWKEGFGDRKTRNVYSITGEAKIDISKGEREKVVRKEFDALIRVQGCKFPIAGTTTFNVDTFDDLKLKFNLDYGIPDDDKNCDCMATIHWGKESQEIDLCDRWWKNARETGKDK
jgi:hypothetical protein